MIWSGGVLEERMTSLVVDAKGCAGGPPIVDVGTEVAVQCAACVLHDFCLSERLMAVCGWRICRAAPAARGYVVRAESSE